jgi:hypothetical protein
MNARKANCRLLAFVAMGGAVAMAFAEVPPQFNYPRLFGVRAGSPVIFRLLRRHQGHTRGV